MAIEQDELTQGINELFAAEEEPQTETPAETEEPQPETTEPEVSETPEVEPAAEEAQEEPKAETVSVDGVEYSTEDLQKYAKVAEWVQNNPEAWEQIEALQSQTSQELRPLPTQDEEWVDPEVRLQRVEGMLNAVLAERTQTTTAQFQAGFQDALGQFYESHPELDEKDQVQLLRRIKEMEILPTYYKKYQGRPAHAARAALEDVYKIEFYDKGPKRKPLTESEARARRKAASASPVAASVSRVEEVPEDMNERIKMMAQEIREAQNANT